MLYYGVLSDLQEFQEIIRSILTGIDRIFIYLDDILVWDTDQPQCTLKL